MKWNYFSIVVAFLFLPVITSANVIYQRLPNGNTVTNPVTITFSFDQSDLIDDDNDSNSYCIALESTTNTRFQNEMPFTRGLTMSGVATFNEPIGTEIVSVVAYGNDDNVPCSNGTATSAFYIEFENADPGIAFTFIENNNNNNQLWGSAGLFGTTTNIASVVATGVTTTGRAVWPLFLFLGVAILFALAIKLQDFIMASGEKLANQNQSKFKRTGNYRSFKRGKKELPGLWDK